MPICPIPKTTAARISHISFPYTLSNRKAITGSRARQRDAQKWTVKIPQGVTAAKVPNPITFVQQHQNSGNGQPPKPGFDPRGLVSVKRAWSPCKAPAQPAPMQATLSFRRMSRSPPADASPIECWGPPAGAGTPTLRKKTRNAPYPPHRYSWNEPISTKFPSGSAHSTFLSPGLRCGRHHRLRPKTQHKLVFTINCGTRCNKESYWHTTHPRQMHLGVEPPLYAPCPACRQQLRLHGRTDMTCVDH